MLTLAKGLIEYRFPVFTNQLIVLMLVEINGWKMLMYHLITAVQSSLLMLIPVCKNMFLFPSKNCSSNQMMK